MDIASIIGLIACFCLMIFGMVWGKDFSVVKGFADMPSALVTFGGSFMCILASYTVPDFVAGLKSIGLIFKSSTMNVPEIIQKIIELSNVARKEGLLSLEEAASDIDDEFLKKGILLIVDGTDPELVRAIMETELVSVEGRHKDKIGFCIHRPEHGCRAGNYFLRFRVGKLDLQSCGHKVENEKRGRDDDEGN